MGLLAGAKQKTPKVSHRTAGFRVLLTAANRDSVAVIRRVLRQFDVVHLARTAYDVNGVPHLLAHSWNFGSAWRRSARK